jgi:CheY-like chemotaxis protein
MKVELRCPDCNSIWHVDQSASGEMLCPSCMKRIPVDESTAVRTLDPAGASVSTEATETTPDAAPDKAPAPTPEWMYNEVVCPRCQLHFQPRRRPEIRKSEPQTVLVVDDLAYFRQIAKEALEPLFEVLTAATHAEARDILDKKEIHLLVLDLTLDGCDAGRDLLAELNPKPCPILIFTAQDESDMYGENWEELKALGADDLVIKGMKVAESLTRKASILLGVPVDEGQVIR